MPEYKYQHPIKILSYTTKNFWLLIIPLARGLYYSRYNFKAWVKGAWLDIFIIFLILGFAITKYLNIKYAFNDNQFYFKKGIFFKSTSVIPYSKLTSITFEYPFFLRPLKCGTLYLDTFSGSKRDAEIIANLRYKDIYTFEKLILSSGKQSKLKYSFYPSKKHLIFFSLFFSNTLSGVILISTFIYQSGKIVGKRLESVFFATFHTVAQKVAKGISPIALGMALVILSGWALSFIINVLVTLQFRAKRHKDYIKIKKGFFTKSTYFLKINKINFIDFKQTLLTLIFKISSVYINCPGYGKGKHALAVLAPITTKQEVIHTLHMLLPDYPSPNITVKPLKNQVQRFIFIPVTLFVCVPLIYLTLIWIFPQWSNLALFLCIILSIPTIWSIVVKAVSTFCTGIGCSGEYITIKYCRYFDFHTIVLPINKISFIKIIQSPYDKNMNFCRLAIFTNAEKTMCHTIRYLPYDQTIALLEKNHIRFLK